MSKEAGKVINMSNSTQRSQTNQTHGLSRRSFLTVASGLGVTSTVMSEALWAEVAEAPGVSITKERLQAAEYLAGLTFTDNERELMIDGLNNFLKKYEAIRSIPLDNAVAPAIQFNPTAPGMTVEKTAGQLKMSPPRSRKRPPHLEEVALWPVTDLAGLIQSGQVTSTELTRMYLNRLKRYDATLRCVVTLTESLALEQAKRADREIAAGQYRGPLHGIPWGAKDLLAVKGYPTTWGAMPFKDQVIDEDATVVERLEEAGAVLVAKLTLGALA